MAAKSKTPTPFGKYVRTLRIDRDEYMKDMAHHLDVSTAYLSAVETGRRNAPHEWADRLQTAYGLTDDEAAGLRAAISASRTYENLNIAHLPAEDRRLVRAFVEQLPNMSTERRELLDGWLNENPL